MAAAQTAEQTAAADKAAADAQDAQTESDQDEAAHAAAEKAPAAKPGTTKAPGLIVVGPVAVLPLVSGGERYVYRGTPVGDEFTKDGVKHAQSVGLVGKPRK